MTDPLICSGYNTKNYVFYDNNNIYHKNCDKNVEKDQKNNNLKTINNNITETIANNTDSLSIISTSTLNNFYELTIVNPNAIIEKQQKSYKTYVSSYYSSSSTTSLSMTSSSTSPILSSFTKNNSAVSTSKNVVDCFISRHIHQSQSSAPIDTKSFKSRSISYINRESSI